MQQKIKNSNLYKEIISPTNIFNAIYSLESYVFEKELLNNKDIKRYNNLSDKYNKKFIDTTIKKCQKEIEELLEKNDKFLNTTVFFKPKKINKDGKVEFRPIHTADLNTQICIVAMLTPLIFDDSNDQRNLSELSRLLPSNFYGNIPSTDVAHLFKSWNHQYKEYSENAIKAQKEYCDTKKYLREVNLDIKQFFPSVNPKWVYNLILSKHPISYTEDDIECLKVVLEKLLFFNLDISDDALENYYSKESIPKIMNKQSRHSQGIAQGLPQAYFFGNLCMTLIAKEIEQVFSGDSYYYVDDSIIYTNTEENDFSENIYKLNTSINKAFDSLASQEFENNRIADFNNRINYEIKIHDKDEKSSIVNIRPDFSLFLFSRTTSPTSFEIFASLDELDDVSIQKKIKTILSVIDYLLFKGKEDDNDIDNTKLLQRYKKFYTNRLNTLNRRENNEIDISIFYNNYGLNNDDEITKFMDALEDDVFAVESRLFTKQLSTNKNLQTKFIKRIKDFENKLHSKKIEHYFSKMLSGHAKFVELRDNKYDSLEKIIETRTTSFDRVNVQKKIKTLETTIKSTTTIQDDINERAKH